MEDENELYGLESDYLPEEEEAVDTVAQSPLSIVRQRVLDTITKSEEEARGYQDTLNRIEEAKQRLLAAPDKRQVLQGLVSKLTTPREQTDPRFYERRNLFTFLRDVGEYGQEQKLAEQEREAKRVALQEMQAKYGMERAEKRGNLARQLAAQYLSKEPTEKTQTTSEFERLIADLPPEEQAKLRRDRARILTTRPTPAALIEKPDTLARDYEIVANPDQYSPNVVAAAQARIEKFKPSDVRKDERSEAAKENLYRSRISRQSRVVIPDIDRAIKILDESPNIAAGNFSNWLVDLPVFGQEAKDLDSILQSVKASVGFGQLEDLKLMSPSGASGLGAVSNFEQQVLQSVEGSLARDMSAPNLKQNLQRLKTFYEVDLPAFIESKGIDLSGVDNRPEKPSGGGKSPAEKAREELERRRRGG
jgi:hypothetical protein